MSQWYPAEKRIWEILATFFALASLIGLAACATTPPPARTLYEDGARVVRLEVTARAARHQHEHPANLKPESLASLLQSLSVEPKKAMTSSTPFEQASRPEFTGESPFFSDKIIQFLVRHVSKGLQRATPLEEVVFAFITSRGSDIQEITSGSFYVQDQRLHLLLANYRHPTMGASEFSRVISNPLEVMGRHAYTIIPGPYGRLERSGGLQSLVTELPDHLIFALAPLKTKPPDIHNTGPQPENATASPATLENRLRELHRLREDGLITEEEFRRLRTKLLESM